MATPTSPREHVFHTREGSRLHYIVRGNGPAIIVLPPAWGVGSPYLQDGLAELEEEFTLIHLEFRGNARSTRPEADHMTCWHLAEDVESLRQELDLDTIPRLMGHSGGGTIALWYAIRFPDKVERLILLNHQLEGFDDSQSMEAALAKKRQDPRFHAALEALTSPWDNLSDAEFATTLRQLLPVYFYDPDHAQKSPLATLAQVPLWNHQMLHGKHRPTPSQETELHHVTAKTLMIFARDDAICTPTQGLATGRGIAHSELVVYEECGHFPWMEKREETLTAITRFFS
ncbi:hypothetical protein ACJ41O_007544 [Fusarium nematophilum]